MSLSMVDGETLWGVYKVSNFKSDENLRRFERAIALSCQFPLALYIQINHIYSFLNDSPIIREDLEIWINFSEYVSIW